MTFSKFGQKFTGQTGILQLMDDLGEVLRSDQPTIMLGGGNPARLPELEAMIERRVSHLLDSGEFGEVMGKYSPPEGDLKFATALAELFREQYGWAIGPENIALTNGSQTSFFYLMNLFAGEQADGSHKKILLPITPEYIGYADVGLSEELFIANKPEIELLDDRTFKYYIDFNTLTITDEVGAICVSRPTQPAMC